MGRRSHPVLYQAPFPLYAVRVDPESGLVITSGGGGAARTGVKNGVHFLRLENIHDKLSASLLHSHDTETQAPMNISLAGDVMAVGQDASCHLLKFKIQKPEEKKIENGPKKAGGKEKGPRKRKASYNAAKDGGGDTKNETTEVTVEHLQAVRTDYSEDSLQKSVCFSPDYSIIATGGVDGFVRVWQVKQSPLKFLLLSPRLADLLDMMMHMTSTTDAFVEASDREIGRRPAGEDTWLAKADPSPIGKLHSNKWDRHPGIHYELADKYFFSFIPLKSILDFFGNIGSGITPGFYILEAGFILIPFLFFRDQ